MWHLKLHVFFGGGRIHFERFPYFVNADLKTHFCMFWILHFVRRELMVALSHCTQNYILTAKTFPHCSSLRKGRWKWKTAQSGHPIPFFQSANVKFFYQVSYYWVPLYALNFLKIGFSLCSLLKTDRLGRPPGRPFILLVSWIQDVTASV